jgi:hypothetical protein
MPRSVPQGAHVDRTFVGERPARDAQVLALRVVHLPNTEHDTRRSGA